MKEQDLVHYTLPKLGDCLSKLNHEVMRNVQNNSVTMVVNVCSNILIHCTS